MVCSSEPTAVFHQGLCVNQLIIGRIVVNINDPCFASTTLQPQSLVLFVVSLHLDSVYAVGSNHNAGSRVSQLILLLLVVRLSLAPRLKALVPVVPADAHCLVLAGKRQHQQSDLSLKKDPVC